MRNQPLDTPPSSHKSAPVWMIVLHGRQGFFAIHQRDVTVSQFEGLLQRMMIDIPRIPCRTPEGCPAEIAALFDNDTPDPDVNADEFLVAFRTTIEAAQAVAAALRDAFPDCRTPLPAGSLETILRVAEFRFYKSL